LIFDSSKIFFVINIINMLNFYKNKNQKYQSKINLMHGGRIPTVPSQYASTLPNGQPNLQQYRGGSAKDIILLTLKQIYSTANDITVEPDYRSPGDYMIKFHFFNNLDADKFKNDIKGAIPIERSQNGWIVIAGKNKAQTIFNYMEIPTYRGKSNTIPLYEVLVYDLYSQGSQTRGRPQSTGPSQRTPSRGPPNQGYQRTPSRGPPNQSYQRTPSRGPPNQGYQRTPSQGPPNQGTQNLPILQCNPVCNYKPGTICFYEKNNKYYEFANFWPATIIDKNNFTYASSEHYFQAHKFKYILNTSPVFGFVKNAPSARRAFDIAQQYSNLVDPNWPNMKDRIMDEALLMKFKQHPNLKILLASTGYVDLVEHSPVDTYWGDGAGSVQPIGKNALGKALMRIRDMIHRGVI
jgi:ribA/ribD-fused uncharacterized protein